MTPPDQRKEVFARIREALRQPAPNRHAAHGAKSDLPATDAFRAWLPAVGSSLEERITLFAQNALLLKADFCRFTSLDEATRHLALVAREENWKCVASHRGPLVSELVEKLGLPCLLTDPGYSVTDLESCDAAITGCEALVAQTGSVFVTSHSAGGRALSVLPPHHVVIARHSHVLPDLASAFQLARQRYAPDWPSFLSFITGPSRTGDIERILVLGAHGPKKLTILLVP